jgi:hypothetical protein
MLTARATTSRTVTDEMLASVSIRPFAACVSGSESVGLNAIELVKETLEEKLSDVALVAAHERRDERDEQQRVREADEPEKSSRHGPAVAAMLETPAPTVDDERDEQHGLGHDSGQESPPGHPPERPVGGARGHADRQLQRHDDEHRGCGLETRFERFLPRYIGSGVGQLRSRSGSPPAARPSPPGASL